MDPSPSKAGAWQPLTLRGVAGFARGSWRRLLLVQFVVGILVATAVVWFLDTAWFPTVLKAIRQLPPRGEIRSGKLVGITNAPRSLAEGHFLAFALDLNHSGQIRSPAHLQVEFGQSNVRFLSLFGFADRPYPTGNRIVAFNRTGLEPWWGAWRPPILWMTFAGVILWLLAVWAILSTIYFLPVWLIGFFANRDLNWSGSWKLAGASLLPGALVMALALVGYGSGVLDLVQLTACAGGHLVIGWIYAGLSPMFLPRHPEAVGVGKNPFAEGEAGGQRSEVGGRRSEVGGQKSEDGGQKSEDGGQKSEGGSQKSEGGG